MSMNEIYFAQQMSDDPGFLINFNSQSYPAEKNVLEQDMSLLMQHMSEVSLYKTNQVFKQFFFYSLMLEENIFLCNYILY